MEKQDFIEQNLWNQCFMRNHPFFVDAIWIHRKNLLNVLKWVKLKTD